MMPSPAAPRTARPRRSVTLLLLVATAAILGGCGSDWNGTRTERDGVVFVQNPAEPIGATEIREMRELWRLPSESADGELLFGAIADAQQDEAGNIYLLDSQLGTVHQISSVGAYVQALGRKGEGPGELQWPMGLVLGRTEPRIGVLDAISHRIVYLTRDGLPLEAWQAAGLDEGLRFSPLFAWEVPAGMLIAYQTRERQERLMTFGDAIALFGADHELERIVTEKSRSHRLDEQFLFDEIAAESFSFLGVRPDGRLYLAPRFEAYRIEQYAPDGSLKMVIECDAPPVPRTPEQIADVRASWAAFYERVRDLELRIAQNRRVILALHPRADGTLWVETSRGWTDLPEGISVAYDQIDADGRYLRQVALRGEIDPWNDYTYLFGDRLLRLTSGFEAAQGALGASGSPEGEAESAPAAPELICYELVVVPS